MTTVVLPSIDKEESKSPLDISTCAKPNGHVPDKEKHRERIKNIIHFIFRTMFQKKNSNQWMIQTYEGNNLRLANFCRRCTYHDYHIDHALNNHWDIQLKCP